MLPLTEFAHFLRHLELSNGLTKTTLHHFVQKKLLTNIVSNSRSNAKRLVRLSEQFTCDHISQLIWPVFILATWLITFSSPPNLVRHKWLSLTQMCKAALHSRVVFSHLCRGGWVIPVLRSQQTDQLGRTTL